MIATLIGSDDKSFAISVLSSCKNIEVWGIDFCILKYRLYTALLSLVKAYTDVAKLIPVTPKVIVVKTSCDFKLIIKADVVSQGTLEMLRTHLVHLRPSISVVGSCGEVRFAKPNVSFI